MKTLLFLLFSLSLFADDSSVLVNSFGDPSPIVDGKVHAITGDLLLSSCDLTIDAAEPLSLTRHYVSGDGEGYRGGWEFFPHTVLEVDGDNLHVSDASGASLSFTYRDTKEDTLRYKIDLGKRSIGYTNTSQGAIGGSTNLRNYRVIRAKYPKESPFILITANGTRREYHRKGETKQFFLTKERLPNGNYIDYSYDMDGEVTMIRALDPQEKKAYAWMQLHYGKEKEVLNRIKVQTSDKREVWYHFSKKKIENPWWNKRYRVYLTAINGDIPSQEFNYVKEFNTERKYVSSFQTSREIGAVEYQYGRVETLSREKNPSEFPDYKFNYSPSFLKRDGTEYVTKGKTTVVNRQDIAKEFLYDTYLRPYAIELYGKPSTDWTSDSVGKRDLLYTETFLWSTESKKQGNLLVKQLITPEKLECKRRYRYDEEFNPVEEELAAHVQCSTHLTTLTTKRLFATGDFHQLLLEKQPDGTITEWQYLKGTNLVIREITRTGKEIKKRTFIRYNKQNLPIEIITDDGAGLDSSDLRGVTERHFTRTSYLEIVCPLGRPEKIETGYLDLPSRQEKILKTIVLFYGRSPDPLREDTYDADGNFAFSRHWTYDKQRRIREETDPLGRKTVYTYDSRGNVASMTDPSGLLTTYFSYNAFHQPLEKKVVSCDGQERKTSFSYHDEKLSLTTNHLGESTGFSYDDLGRCKKTCFSSCVVNEKLHSRTEEKEFDILGHETKINAPDGIVTKIVPNFFGKPLRIDHHDGTNERFSYNKVGDLLFHILPSGVKEEYLYDWQHRVTEKKSLSPNGAFLKKEGSSYSTFHLEKQEGPLGVETLYTYDGAGRISQERCGERTTSYKYDALGRLYKKISHDCVQVTLYDFLDRVVEERAEDLTGSILLKTNYVYNTLGLKSQEIKAAGNEISSQEWRYDPLGRIVEEVDPIGNRTHISYSTYSNGLKQTLEEITTCDPEGVLTIERFDAQDHLISKEKRFPYTLTISQETYLYNSRGNLIDTETKILENGVVQETYHLALAYDSCKRLISRTEAAGDPAQRQEQYTYNALGYLEKKILPSGVELLHTYDCLGNLKELISSDQTIHYHYTYDAKSQLIQVEDLIHKTLSKRSYNAFGELLTDTLSTGLTLTHSYNPSGSRKELLLPDKSAITYTHQGPFLRSVSRGSYTHTYDAYDTSGHLLQETHIDSTTTAYTYDKTGRRTGATSSHTTSQIDLLSKTGNTLQETTDSTSTTYSYDPLNQLTSDGAHTYTYNSRYCRTSRDGTPIPINIHGEHLSDAYDANGNCTSRNNWRYTYDALGRMTSASSPTQTITYTYDSFNRRLSKTTNGITTRFLYDSAREIGSLAKDNTLIDLRVLGRGFGAEIGATLAIELDGALYLPLHDLRGNITHLIDSSGTPHQSLSYTPFGSHNGTLLSPWGFSSKRLDLETELYFFGNRYYDPKTTTWLTPDPLQTPYPYTFAANNPLFFLDLYGLDIDSFSETNSFDTFNFGLPYGIPVFSPQTSQFIGAMGGYATTGIDNSLIFIGTHLSIAHPEKSVCLALANAFHPEKPFSFDPSQIVFGRTETLPSFSTIHINGILTDLPEAGGRVNRMEKQIPEGNISVVYSASGGFMRDIKNSFLGLLSIPTNEDFLALRHIKGQLNAVGPTGKVFMSLFSRGTIIFDNVTKYLTGQEKKQLYVYSYGGVRFFRRKDFGEALNLVSIGDDLAMTALAGRHDMVKMLRSGELVFLEPEGLFFDHCYNNATGKAAQNLITDNIRFHMGY